MPRRPDINPNATPSDILAAVEKLCRQIENLNRNVQRLAARVQAPEDNPEDESVADIPDLVALFKDIMKWRASRGRSETAAMHYILTGLEYKTDSVFRDIGLIQSQMDVLANGSYLTDDLKRWLNTDKP